MRSGKSTDVRWSVTFACRQGRLGTGPGSGAGDEPAMVEASMLTGEERKSAGIDVGATPPGPSATAPPSSKLGRNSDAPGRSDGRERPGARSHGS